MGKTKKILLAVTASVAMSSAFTSTAFAKAYKVVSGDTLWGIAIENNTSVSSLRSLNDISGNLIFPGQIIQTTSSSSNSSSPSVSTSTGSDSGSSNTTYTVQSGDTLWALARKYNVSVSSLKDWNNLSSDLIFIGQKLAINGTASSSNTSASTTSTSTKRTTQVKAETVSYSTNSSIVVEAKKYIGTPYVWGGSAPGGFDCSGYIYYVLNQAGVSVPRTSAAGFYNMSTKVSNPQPGDLVFFSGTYKPGISHMGIYIGNGKMIQAGSSTGVTVSSIHGPYWGDHFTGYGRP